MSTSNPSSNASPSEILFDVSSFLDTTRPNLARIFDYLAGGSTHFEADRVAANKMWSQFQPLKKWVRLREAFGFEATQSLYDQGFRQFLDLGSGMPQSDAAHRLVPNSRFVYSDINPIAVSYGSSLFAELEHVAYAYGDARDLLSLLQSQEVLQTIDKQEKIAIGLNNLTLFLSDAEISQAAQQLFSWAPQGSKIFVFLQSKADNLKDLDLYNQFESQLLQIGLPIQFNYLTETIKQFTPWQVKFMEPIPLFMGLPTTFLDHSDGIDVGLQYHAAFFVKE